ncbi:MAG: hypothetical protein ABIG95_06800 [Candidatus Woesearchaeota archaeon]
MKHERNQNKLLVYFSVLMVLIIVALVVYSKGFQGRTVAGQAASTCMTITQQVQSDGRISLYLKWNQIVGKSGYQIYKNGAYYSSAGPFATTFLDTNVYNSGTITYKVSDKSNWASCSGSFTVAPTCTPSCNKCDLDGNGVITVEEAQKIWQSNIDINCDGNAGEIADVQWCSGNCIKATCADYGYATSCTNNMVCEKVYPEGNLACCKCVPPRCTDSDGGQNLFVAGEAVTSTGGVSDYCDFMQGSVYMVMEAICQDGVPTHLQLTCPNEAPYCNRAVCSQKPPVCTDSDNGENVYLRGTVKESRMAIGPESTDYCENLGTKQPWNNCYGDNCGVREYYCQDQSVFMAFADYYCPLGCKDGACLQRTCTDTDGINYNTKGSCVDNNAYIYPVSDHCQNDDGVIHLYEMYCHPYSKQCFSAPGYVCPDGFVCSDGACVPG